MSNASNLAFRNTGLGGSDIAVIFGKNPHKTVHELWMEKRGLLIPEDISEKGVIKRGNKLEPLIADEFAEENDIELENPEMTFRGDRPWMFAHPDRMYSEDGKRIGLEIKTANRAVFLKNVHKGLQDGYLFQVIYYLYICGADEWKVRMKHPDSWDDHDWTIKRTPATDEIWSRIIEKGEWFWNLVETGVEPPRAKVEKLPESNGGQVVTVPDAEIEVWSKVGAWLKEAQEIKAQADETISMAKEAVKKVMESNGWMIAEGPVEIPGRQVQTLRVHHTTRKGGNSYKGKGAVALLDSLATMATDGDLVGIRETLSAYNSGQFVTVKASSRPLLPFWIKPQIEGDTE